MGIVIEFNIRITERILNMIKANPNVKSFSYGRFGGDIELKDEITDAQADVLLNQFKNQLIKKRPGIPTP